ncbi:hypothetical protein [Micrococcus luteus]|uniref:hypothetical protein n=1 Tax=Micrococcus luteus TaxID=1270 RepID=UPI00331ADCF0
MPDTPGTDIHVVAGILRDWAADVFSEPVQPVEDFHAEARALLKILAAHGLAVVNRNDLAETFGDAAVFNRLYLGGDDATTARLDRLGAVLRRDTP